MTLPLISYAQNNEDVLLWRALRHVGNGFYVDVGANHPVEDSVTKLFYDRGWRGINVEPSPLYVELLREQRPHDTNLACVAGDSDGTATFYESSIRGWSTSDPAVGEQYVARGEAVRCEFEQLRLDTILQRHAQGDIHFLKIDVEGAEDVVLRGLDLQRYRPWVLVIEGLDPITKEPRFAQWEPQVLANGYALVHIDGLNRFYLASEHADLEAALAAPPNVLDDFVTIAQSQLQEEADRQRVLADEVRHNAEHLQQQLASTSATLELTSAALESTTATLDATTRERDALAAHRDALTYQRDGLTRERNALARDRDALAAQRDALARERDGMVQSISWRLTRPLRMVNAVRTRRSVQLRQKLKQVARTTVARTNDVFNRQRAVKNAIMAIVRRLPFLENALQRALTSHLNAATIQQAEEQARAAAQQDAEKGTVDLAELVDASRPVHGAQQAALPLPAGQRVLYVYVDHTVHCDTNTGVQRVTRGLAAGLLQLGERVRFVKWHAATNQCVLIDAEEREHLARWNGPLVTDEDRALYRSPDEPLLAIGQSPAAENHWLVVPEVTHLTVHPEPVTLDLLSWSRRAGLKSGFVFYDAIPLRREDLAQMAAKHATYMQQLLLADVVWPISEWSARDLVAFWREAERADAVTMPQVLPLPLPGESLHHPRATTPQPGEHLILSVGSIEPRKNQVRLIHAFEAHLRSHPDSDWRLVLVGNLHPAVAEEVTRATESFPAIRHLGHVSDEQLDTLYRTCAFTVFPSVEEGFGLPILESLWYGKPCLCADFGAMAEVAQAGGCLRVDTRDDHLLGQALDRLIQDPQLLASLRQEATQARIQTWHGYSQQITARIDQDSQPARKLGPVYFWIDGTVQFPKNTGIQRVTRQLARSLMELGASLIPVKFDRDRGAFGPVTPEDLAFFAQWNGPAPDAWQAWVPPAASDTGRTGWFFMPDLPLNRAPSEREQVLRQARTHGLKTAAVFYDAIPWKLRRIYPPHFASAHREYMAQLGEYDLVLPISEFSRKDLLDFLGGALPRPIGLDDRIRTVVLAGEFAETARVTDSTVRTGAPVKLLCVGTVEPRKNHLALLEGFDLAARRSPVPLELTIVGRPTEPDLQERVNAFIATHPNVTWDQDADDTSLHRHHLACDFTVYPSIEEGFGLPILESLWYGKPCICANFGAMAEVAAGGGCIEVDVRDPAQIADAIVRLADPQARTSFWSEAVERPFKSWRDYGLEVALRLAESAPPARPAVLDVGADEARQRAAAMHLAPRPLLSVCISTYNRAEWLSASLRNWTRLYPEPLADVELLVCDNTSTDHTPDVVRPYLSRPDFAYHRNPANVGMLGNLRETAHHARGDYVWILGDDDLLKPGAIETVVGAIRSHPDVALVYLNYAYTREDDARKVKDFASFLAEATPIVPPEPDREGPIRAICARNENFFTAIYTLVFRRDHAMRAYSQDTSGRPFSTMPTCIPTTNYVLRHMMDLPGVWIGTPQVVVNLNVSWMKYAPLWILERVPEMYELAERQGVPAQDMDRWRRHTLGSVAPFYRQIFGDDPLGNARYFSPSRLVRRFKHLPEFDRLLPELREVYSQAQAAGHPVAAEPLPIAFQQGDGQ